MRVARSTGNGASPRQCELLRVMLSPVPPKGRLDAGESLAVLAVIPFVIVKAGFRQDLLATTAAVTGVSTTGCRANLVPRLFLAPCQVEGGVLKAELHLRVGKLVTVVEADHDVADLILRVCGRGDSMDVFGPGGES